MNTDMNIRQPKAEQISDQLYLITLYPPIRGFDNFITCWLYKSEITCIFDVGPSVTAPGLIDVLKRMGIERLDYIFLTHVHIDHAGGIGQISQKYPETPVVTHEKAIAHLIDPGRLWEGTVKTLGDLARAYGPIDPVPEDRILNAENFSDKRITPVITPGHAVHHVSYIGGPYLFAGEVGGVFLRLSENKEYLRPATPPKFFLDVSVKSIDGLIEKNPEKICYSHYGLRDGAVEMLQGHKDQLYFWEREIREELDGFVKKDFVSDCIDRLLRNDPLLANFSLLDDAAMERERGFLANSVRGFVGYLERKED